MKYNRTFTELQTNAALWWPEDLKDKNALANVLPLLLRTQDDFLHILTLSKKEPFQVFDCIKAAQYPTNLFLKHLAVLADYGGEPMQRLGRSFTEKVISNGSILLEGYSKKNGIPFDILVEKGNKKIGIEISFQVTTNSTIERKAGQSADRQMLMHANGYHIAYVIDGAGNFQRSSAISTICNHSDCTVAYTAAEFKVLTNWIKSVL